MDMILATRINKLRADFLRNCSEEDQLKRIIKPYGNFSSDTILKQIFEGDDGTCLIDKLESPPITENYMDGMSSRLKKSTNSEEKNSEHNQRVSDEESEVVEPKELNEFGVFIGPECEKDIVNDSNKRHVMRIRESIYDLSITPSVFKGARKSKKHLRSIFNFQATKESKKSIIKHKLNGSGGIAPMNSKSVGLYDGEFVLDEYDEEDNEEDNEELDSDANRRFFYADGKLKEDITCLHPTKSPGATKQKPTKNSIIIDTLSLNFQNSTKPGVACGTISNRVGVALTVPQKRANVCSNSKVDPEIESFINENELDPLELTRNGTMIGSKLNKSQHITRSSRNNVMNFRNNNLGDDSGVSTVDSDPDEASSYGASLLYSDSNETGSQTHDTIELCSGAVTDRPRGFLNNLIPSSSHSFGIMYHGTDASTGCMVDFAKTNCISHYQNLDRSHMADVTTVGNDALLSYVSKKWSDHFQNLTESPVTRNWVSQFAMDESLKSRTGRYYKYKQNTSKVDDSNLKTKSKLFLINKTDSYPEPHQKSKLSSLLRHSNAGGDINLLKYFVIASVPNTTDPDAITLDVYIQLSETYKKKPFKIAVNKSASIFEVLGYALYCYTTKYKPENIDTDGLDMKELNNPNYFTLKIVDEKGEPFEDNFGVLERTQMIGTVSDNEVVICRVKNYVEFQKNSAITPLPKDFVGKFDMMLPANLKKQDKSSISVSTVPISALDRDKVEIKVYPYQDINSNFKFTTVKVSSNAKLDQVLIQYFNNDTIKLRDYTLKFIGKNLLVDLNESLASLNGQYELEVIKKEDARINHIEKSTSAKTLPPTIQSIGLITPSTLNLVDQFIGDYDTKLTQQTEPTDITAGTKLNTGKKHHSLYKLGMNRQHSLTGLTHSIGAGGLLKTKNSSKNLLEHQPTLNNNLLAGGSSYKDLFVGAYYKYKVWRRQQVSFINKHERTLAIDGDYVYIIPPVDGYHWNQDAGKTKSFHINQVSLVKRSKRVAEYFKIFVTKVEGEKRYYFEAVSPDECIEIVSRLHNLLAAYKMNRKIK